MGSSFSIPSNGPNQYSRDLNNANTNANSTMLADSERHGISISTDRDVTTDSTLSVEAAQPQTTQPSMPRYFVVGSGGSNSGARGQAAHARPSRRSASHQSLIAASPNESSSSAQAFRRPSLSSRIHDVFHNLRSSSEEHRERTRREDRQLREEVDDGERARREGCGSSSEPGLVPMDMDDGNATPIPMDLDGGNAGEGTVPARPRINIARRTPTLRFSRFRSRSQSLGAQPANSSTAAEDSASTSDVASTDRQPHVTRELFGSLSQPTSPRSEEGGDGADIADGTDGTGGTDGGDNESARPARHRVMERMLATAVAAAWSTISNGSTGRGLFGRGQSNNRTDDQGIRHQTGDARRNGAIQGVEDGLDEIISILTSGLPRPSGGAANNGNGDVEAGVAGVAEVLQAGEAGRPPRFQPTADGRGFIINAGDGSTMRMFRLPSGNPVPPANGPDGRPRMVPVVFIAIRTVSPTRDTVPHETQTDINAQPQPTGTNSDPAIVEHDNVNQALPAGMQAAEQSSQDARARRTISWIVYIVGGSVPPGHPMASWGLPPGGNGETAPGAAMNPDLQQNRNISPGANPFQALFSDNPSYEDLLLLSMLLGPARSPTTTQSEIDAAIPMQIWSEEVKNGLLGDSDKCRVCLSDYEEGEEVRILGCKHGFHRECIDKWLTEGSNKCPLCRSTPVGNQQETPVTAQE